MTSSGAVCRTYGIIDNLTYAYNDPTDKNKLSAVKDLGELSRGFKSISTTVNNQTTHYTYDDNGNLKTDAQKGITNILYNHLNLPKVIFFANNNRIEFIYDATGAKLQKRTFVNGVLQINDVRNYVNGIEYKGLNLVLDRFPTTEGAVVLQSNGTTYQYEYTLKDHLGNARVTYSDGNNDGVVGVTDIKQVNHYYPFGLNMEGNWNGSYADVKNKYQYNGKEWNDDFGLGWNHHDWRFLDVATGRFVTVDPEGESKGQVAISPYHFSYDNPIRFSDPDGLEGEECCGGIAQATAQVTGGIIGFTDNLLGSNLRESVGNHLFGDGSLRGSFNAGVTQADQMSVVGGTALVAGGGLTVTGGAAVSTTGVGAAGGVPAMAVGGLAIVAGGALAINGAKNLQNSQVKANDDNSKKSNVSSGNKNSAHANQKAKEAAQQRYQSSKSEYDALKSKPNKTPDDKKALEKLRKEVERNKLKADNTGETHSRNAKGNNNNKRN